MAGAQRVGVVMTYQLRIFSNNATRKHRTAMGQADMESAGREDVCGIWAVLLGVYRLRTFSNNAATDPHIAMG